MALTEPGKIRGLAQAYSVHTPEAHGVHTPVTADLDKRHRHRRNYRSSSMGDTDLIVTNRKELPAQKNARGRRSVKNEKPSLRVLVDEALGVDHSGRAPHGHRTVYVLCRFEGRHPAALRALAHPV